MKKLLADLAAKAGKAILDEGTRVATRAGAAGLRAALAGIEEGLAADPENPTAALAKIDPSQLGARVAKEALSEIADSTLERVEGAAVATARAAKRGRKKIGKRKPKSPPPRKVRMTARVIDVEGKEVK